MIASGTEAIRAIARRRRLRSCSRCCCRRSARSASGSSAIVFVAPDRRLTGEVGLQQVGSGERVGWRTRAFALARLGHPRRQPLVVGLDRHLQQGLQFGAEAACQRGLRALLATEVQGQADDHLPDLVLGDQLDDRARVGRLDRRQRRRQGAARVGDRAADPRGAVVERQYPHQLSSASIARRAVASACSSPEASFPPACAISSRPPPPPPTSGAASRPPAAAETPLRTAPLETSTTSPTLSRSAPPSAIADSPPSFDCTRLASSSICFWSASGTSAATTLVLFTFVASPVSRSASSPSSSFAACLAPSPASRSRA